MALKPGASAGSGVQGAPSALGRVLARLRVQPASPGLRADLGVALGLALLAVAVAHRVLGEGYPPGVDTPTFLHLSWFTSETLQGRGGLVDPYWYGGFRAFTTYPPLSYVPVGMLAAIPGVGLVLVYKIALLAAYAGTGYAAYYLARELGQGRPWAAVAGAITVLSYPVQVAVGLWGWYSSMVALPLGLLALALLERASQRGSRASAIAGGGALGLSFLAHHMTAMALALALPFWVLFSFLGGDTERRRSLRALLLFLVAAVATTVWWIVPWLGNLLAAGFQREVPGLWTFPPSEYLQALARRSLIGTYAYPNYLGVGLTALGIGGILYGFVVRSRVTPYALFLVALTAFSLGEQANPLVRVGPLRGLDVARFQLYMAPVIAVVGMPFVASLGLAVGQLLGDGRRLRWLRGAGAGLALALLLGQTVWDSAEASRKLFGPYRLSPSAQEMVQWLGQDGRQGKVLGVGFWHWETFFLPFYLRRPVVDGWHDEGARNWRTVRALRLMMWSGEIDVPKAHALLGELGGGYIAVQDYFAGESPKEFRSALGQYPQLFAPVAQWGDVTVFERIPQG